MKRAVIASLWFIAAFCMHDLAWSIVGSPRILGLALGAVAAAFVLIDPLRMLAREAVDVPTPTARIGSVQPAGR